MSYPLADKYPSQTPERILARAKEHYERNKNNPEWVERRRAWALKWQRENKERKQFLDRRWREQNPTVKYKSNSKTYGCGKAIRTFLFDGVNTDTVLRLIGCSRITLRKHFESLFKAGMTWSNHGSEDDQWQVDHITPLCAFDLSNLEQRYKANHYTNLQPLWTLENRLKKCSGLSRKWDLHFDEHGIPHRKKSIMQGFQGPGHDYDLFFYVGKNLTNND